MLNAHPKVKRGLAIAAVPLAFIVGAASSGGSKADSAPAATPAPTVTVTEPAKVETKVPDECRKAINLGTALAANTDDLLNYFTSGEYLSSDVSKARSLGERIGKTRAEYRIARAECDSAVGSTS